MVTLVFDPLRPDARSVREHLQAIADEEDELARRILHLDVDRCTRRLADHCVADMLSLGDELREYAGTLPQADAAQADQRDAVARQGLGRAPRDAHEDQARAVGSG